MNYKQRSLTVKQVWTRLVLAIFCSIGLLFAVAPVIVFLLFFGYMVWALICITITLLLVFGLVHKLWHPVCVHRKQLENIC
jgi:uncharacterized membrane protein YedE/YeeE